MKKRFFHYLIFKWENKIILQKRSSNDIWAHLYEFPLIETSESNKPLIFADYKMKEPRFSSEIVKHILSHQHLFVQFHVFDCKPQKTEQNWLEIELDEFENYPIPRVIDRFLPQLFS